MKTNKISKTFVILMILVSTLAFQSCITFSGILEENDVVYSSKRISYRHVSRDHNRKTPLIHLDQTFVKEIRNKDVTYSVYDILNLNSSSFKVEDKVFIIVGDKVFNVNIVNKELDFSKNIRENKSDLLTADSTKISVVTGYSEENVKITRFTYQLTNEMVSSIKRANQVTFRYYAGPSMMSVKLGKYDLKRIKKVLNK